MGIRKAAPAVAARQTRVRNQSGEPDQERFLNRPTPAVQGAAHLQKSPDMLSHLQRTVGNRATIRLLAANRRVPSPAHIMRYPETVLDQPLKKSGWKKHTKSVKKSGEGASGGAFFFGSSHGSIKTVVVKADPGKSDSTDNANEQLAAAGVFVPTARNMSPSGDEGKDIVATAQKRGYDLTKTGENNSKNTGFLRVMSLSAGNSLSSIVKKAGGAAPDKLAASIDETVKLLMDDSIQQQLSTLIATDIVLGNNDRINLFVMNLGNLMIKPGPKSAALPRALGPRVTAIDSDARLTESVFTSGPMESLTALTDDPAAIIKTFLLGVEINLETVSKDAARLFLAHEKYGALEASLVNALKQAALKQAALGVITGPAPLAPDSKPASGNQQKAQAPEGNVSAEMRRRRRIVWGRLK